MNERYWLIHKRGSIFHRQEIEFSKVKELARFDVSCEIDHQIIPLIYLGTDVDAPVIFENSAHKGLVSYFAVASIIYLVCFTMSAYLASKAMIIMFSGLYVLTFFTVIYGFFEIEKQIIIWRLFIDPVKMPRNKTHSIESPSIDANDIERYLIDHQQVLALREEIKRKMS